jgi:hypothetical protein
MGSIRGKKQAPNQWLRGEFRYSMKQRKFFRVAAEFQELSDEKQRKGDTPL